MTGERLIESARSLAQAAHFLRLNWGNRAPTILTLARLRIFKRIVGENVYSEGLELPSVGTKAHSNLKSIRPPHGPYPSVKDNPANTLGRLRPDVLEGLLPAFTADCEEFGESPTGGTLLRCGKTKPANSAILG